MDFVDKTLVCSECGAEFVFTAGEQEFYQNRGLQNEPRRCKNCRNVRKADSSRRVNTEVTCASCGVVTQVPFQPRGDRPVYCRQCFDAMKQNG